MPEDKANLDLIDDEDPSFFEVEEAKDDELSGPEESTNRMCAVLADGTVVDKSTGEVLDDPNPDSGTDDSRTESDPVDGSFTPDGKSVSDSTPEELCDKPNETGSSEDENDPTDVPSDSEPEKPDSDAILNSLLKAANHKKVRELCEFGRSYCDMNYQDDFAYLVGRIQEIAY